MKITRSKPVKKSPLGKPSPPSKSGKIPMAKARILGTGTFQKREHSPRVV